MFSIIFSNKRHEKEEEGISLKPFGVMWKKLILVGTINQCTQISKINRFADSKGTNTVKT